MPCDPNRVLLLSIYPEKTKTLVQKTYMHLSVHNSTVYRSQGVKTDPGAHQQMTGIRSGVCAQQDISHKRKRNYLLLQCWWTQNIMLSETTQKEKMNTTWYHLYVKPRKSTQMNVNTKQKPAPRQTEFTSPKCRPG